MSASEILSTINPSLFLSDVLGDGDKLVDIKKRLQAGELTQSEALEIVEDEITKIIADYSATTVLLKAEEANQNVTQDIISNYGSRDNLLIVSEVIFHNREEYQKLYEQLKAGMQDKKNFDKKQCFANIRFLLEKNPSVKIGQIEKEAGLRLGYMARLEKPDNTAEPSVEFIVSAAKLLNVSLDSLMLVDITALSSTEEYLRSFLEKLQKDTQKDTISWEKESASYLNDSLKHIATRPDEVHDLFTTSQEQVTDGLGRIGYELYFASNAFGLNTSFTGDCFNCEIATGTKVYLLNVRDSIIPVNSSIEIWMSSKNGGSQFLIRDQEGSPLASLVKSLYALAQEQDRHPKIKDTLRAAIDEYLKNDLPF